MLCSARLLNAVSFDIDVGNGCPLKPMSAGASIWPSASSSTRWPSASVRKPCTKCCWADHDPTHHWVQDALQCFRVAHTTTVQQKCDASYIWRYHLSQFKLKVQLWIWVHAHTGHDAGMLASSCISSGALFVESISASSSAVTASLMSIYMTARSCTNQNLICLVQDRQPCHAALAARTPIAQQCLPAAVMHQKPKSIHLQHGHLRQGCNEIVVVHSL